MHTFPDQSDFSGAPMFTCGWIPNPNQGFNVSMLEHSNVHLCTGALYSGTSFEPRFPIERRPQTVALQRAQAVPRTEGNVNWAYATNAGDPQVATAQINRMPLTDYYWA